MLHHLPLCEETMRTDAIKTRASVMGHEGLTELICNIGFDGAIA